MRRPLLNRGMDTTSVLAGIVIIAVILLVLFWLVGRFGAITSSAQSDEACEASVSAQAFAGALEKGDVVQLQCTTNYKTVNAAAEDAQKKAIADSMTSCWRRFHQGRLKIFAVESGRYCVVCDRLTFSEGKEITGLTRYLYATKMAPNARSYAEYLMNMEGTTPIADAYAAANTDSISTEMIDTRQPVAILFVADKTVDSTTDYFITGGAAVGSTLLIISGAGAPAGLVGWAAILGTSGAVAATTHYSIGPYFRDQDWRAWVDVAPYDAIDFAQKGCNRLEGRAGPLEFIS